MVRDFGWQLPLPHEQSAMYRPRLPIAGARVSLAVRVRDPEAFAARLRTVAADVDPTIRLTDVQPLAQVGGGGGHDQLGADRGRLAGLVHRVAALGDRHPFADVVHRRAADARDRHSRRARRAARDASWPASSRARSCRSARACSPAADWLRWWASDRRAQVLLLLAADGIMLVVGLTACAVPLRRALRIDPTEALRAEG